MCNLHPVVKRRTKVKNWVLCPFQQLRSYKDRPSDLGLFFVLRRVQQPGSFCDG